MPARLDALLRCGSCRFAAYYFLSFQIAIVDAGLASWRWVIFGFFFWFLHSMAIELLNRYSDRVEDTINRPERTALCDLVGYSRIKLLTFVIWILIALIYCAWLLAFPNTLLAILLWSGLLAGISYSVLFRLKARRYLALVALTFPFCGPFLIGWAATHDGLPPADLLNDLFLRLGPFLLVGGLFFIGHAGIKDITDIVGDERIGYQSVWIDLLRRRANGTILLMISAWSIADACFVAVGALPGRFLLLLGLWPLSYLFATVSPRATVQMDREAVRELFYHYWFLFMGLSLYLLVPTAATLMSIIGIAAYWVFASQFLHWTRGVTRINIERFVSLARDTKVGEPTPDRGRCHS